MVVKLRKFRTLAEVLDRLGNVPLGRIRVNPPLGTAVVDDVERIQAQEGVICELVEGVLLEKTMGMMESFLAVYLAELINQFVRPNNLGIVLGTDGTIQIKLNLVRIPDVAFINWERFPERRLPKEAIPLVVPNLAVEVLSTSNTRREMAIKRGEYFQAGVELVWEVDPKKRIIDVYLNPTDKTTLTTNDTLDGGTVLPGFQLPLKDLFAELDRQG